MNKHTQQETLLLALKQSTNGVNSYYATYNMRIKQAPTRIKELREKGYIINSVTNPDRSVNWILSGVPSIKKTQQYVFIDNRAIPVENMKPIQDRLLG